MISKDIIRIPSYQVDEFKRLRVASFLELAQQIAEDNSEALGFGYNALIAKNDVWILSRMRMRIVRMPIFKETVSFETWHSGTFGPLFKRDYEMRTMDGEPLILSDSAWAIMDLDTRAVQRPDRFDIPAASLGRESSLEGIAQKVRIPSDAVLEQTGERTALYSDIDYNHHVNNAKYLVWAMDFLGPVGESAISEINVNFSHEVAPGSTVTLHRYRTADTVYIEVMNGGVQAFVASFLIS